MDALSLSFYSASFAELLTRTPFTSVLDMSAATLIDHAVRVATFVALILAFGQTSAANQQTRNLKQIHASVSSAAKSQTQDLKQVQEAVSSAAAVQAKNLKDIQESLSTRYLGEFPDFVPSVVDLLKQAKGEIVILCDYPCYSYFSDHKNWIDYSRALADKLRDPKINEKSRIAFTEPALRKRLLADQFNYTDHQPDRWKADPRIRQLLSQFLLNVGAHDQEVDALTFKTFIDHIEDENKAELKHGGLKVIKTREVHTAPPIYFWIVDATSAIFSIPSYTDFTREQGFQTSDARLIASLQGIWKRMAQQTTGSPLKNADDTSKAA